jgi:hypothetical protein
MVKRRMTYARLRKWVDSGFRPRPEDREEMIFRRDVVEKWERDGAKRQKAIVLGRQRRPRTIGEDLVMAVRGDWGMGMSTRRVAVKWGLRPNTVVQMVKARGPYEFFLSGKRRGALVRVTKKQAEDLPRPPKVDYRLGQMRYSVNARERLRRLVVEGVPVKEAAGIVGVSRQLAHYWMESRLRRQERKAREQRSTDGGQADPVVAQPAAEETGALPGAGLFLRRRPRWGQDGWALGGHPDQGEPVREGVPGAVSEADAQGTGGRAEAGSGVVPESGLGVE